jgi:hypothetical protein
MPRWNKGRQKSKALQIDSGVGGFYTKPNDPQAALRFSTDAQESMWADVPVVPFKEVAASAKLYDFRGTNDTTNIWESVKNADSSVFALVDQKNGGIRFTTTESGGDPTGEYNQVETSNYTFAIESGKQTWIEFRLSMQNDSKQADVELGFGDGRTDRTTLGSNVVRLRLLDFNDRVGIQVTADDANIVTAMPYDTLDTPSSIYDGEPHNVGMHFEPSSNTPGRHHIFVFIDGDLQTIINDMQMPTEPMGVFVSGENDGTVITVEHVFVIQED